MTGPFPSPTGNRWRNACGLHRVAAAVVRADRDRRERVAMRNPEYARIERLRQIPGSANTVMYSDDAGLGWDEWDYQSKLVAAIPSRPWVPFARWVADRPVRRLRTRSRRAWQRVRRGWDDTAVWNLDHHLCQQLAEQLSMLAERAHGWPSGERFPTFEAWQETRRSTAVALSAYTTRAGTALQAEHSATLRRGVSDTDRSAAGEAAAQEEAAIIADAQSALHWVADHLPMLWD